MAAATVSIVVALEYRLPPAHTFPAAHDDCLAALEYCRAAAPSLGGTGWVGLGGDSAGGLLVAAATLTMRQRGFPQAPFQFLAYPLLAGDSETPSRQEFGAPDLANMLTGWRAYAGNAEISPLLAPLTADDVSGLPPAFMITAALDPLRDEGEMYAKRLGAAGVPVTHIQFPKIPHGFLTSNKFPGAREAAFMQLAGEIRKSFTASTLAAGP